MIKELGDICTPKQWKTISEEMLTQDGYPVYGANGVIGFFSEYNHENSTLLVTCRGATCGALNICVPYSYVNGNAMALDNLSDDVDIKYLKYYLQYRGFQDVITGSAQPQIVRKNIEKIKVFYPEKEKQFEIVKSLESVDKVIDWHKELLSIHNETIRSRFIEFFSNTDNRVKLSDVAHVSGGLTKNSKREKLELKLPYLRVANVSFASIDVTEMLDIGLTEQEKEKTLLQFEDLLFVEGNGSPEQIGKVAIWRNEVVPCVHQNHLIKARFNQSKMLPTYAMYYFMSQEGREQIKKTAVTTSGLFTLSVSKIADFTLPFPTMETQQKFVDFANQVESAKKAVQESLDNLEILKKSLMQKYFG